MKTGSIPHPEGVYYLAIRPEYLAMCENDACSAAILNLFEFWHDSKLGHDDVSLEPGKPEIHISTSKLRERLLNVWSREKIEKQLKVLDEIGLVKVLKAGSSYDRRNAYLFNVKLVVALIDQWIEQLNSAPPDIVGKPAIDRRKTSNRSTENQQSISIDSSIDSIDSFDSPAKPELSKKKVKAQKKPRVPQPTDGCFDAFCAGFARIQVLDLTKAIRQAWDWRAAQALNGDTERGCPGLLALLGIDRADADRLKALAPRITRFWHWYYRTHPDSELKDCVKILEYWTIWEAQEVKRRQKTVKGQHPADCPGGCGGLGQVEVKPGEWAICSGRKTA